MPDKKKHGTNNRKRTHQVGVRLLPGEMEQVQGEATRRGISPAEALRAAFFGSPRFVVTFGPVEKCTCTPATPAQDHAWDPTCAVHRTGNPSSLRMSKQLRTAASIAASP